MSNIIKFIRGAVADIPTLNQGEPAFTTDTKKLYIGDGSENHPIMMADAPELEGELDCGAHSVGFTQQSAIGDGATTIDWKLGNKFFFTFENSNEVFTFTAPTKPGNLLLVMKQYSTGGKTATWPNVVKWPSGNEPVLSTGNNSIDIISFYWDGTYYYGVASLNFSIP